MKYFEPAETGAARYMWRVILAMMVAALSLASFATLASAQSPTCADVLDIENHGHHIVGDYVTGVGHLTFDWPPVGSVGTTIGGNGASTPGAPGIHQHGGGEFQPGASFCVDQANSPTGNEFPGQRP
jgi:hypothetical protein